MQLEEIAPLRGPKPPGATSVRRRSPHVVSGQMSRRGLLSVAAAAGGAAGFAALGLFPPARAAIAQGYRGPTDKYYEIYEYCPSYASKHNCSPGCGPSVVRSTACRTTGKRAGFHRSSKSDPGYFALRPNDCVGHYDGWIWKYTKACGNCTGGITWRCHDGYKKGRRGRWYRTICRKALSCERE